MGTLRVTLEIVVIPIAHTHDVLVSLCRAGWTILPVDRPAKNHLQSLECVTGIEIAAIESTLEPACSICGRAVSKGVWVHVTA